MILQCSECQARFLVPDAAIGAKGRTVRCGKCAHSWFQEPSPELAKQELPDLDTLIEEINTRPKPVPKGSNLPKVKKEKMPMSQVFSFVFMIVVVVALGLLVSMPSVYGLPTSKGLVLADVGVIRVVDKDKHVSFHIEGKIANTTAHIMNVPTLRITLVDKEGASLQYWDFSGDMATLEPGKDVPFATGDLAIRFDKGTKFVTELGSPLELALRRKPQ